jgi:recombination associated protein RdgC
MPILRGTVSFARFRVQSPDKEPFDAKRKLARGLKTRAFEPIDRKGEEDRMAGFVEVEDPDATEFSAGALYFGERALFSWRIDQLKAPSSRLKSGLEAWQRQFEAENERAPSRQEKATHKEALRQQLRSKADPISRTHDVAWNLETERLTIWATSRKVVEEISLALEELFEVRLVALTALAQASEAGEGGKESALRPTASLLGLGSTEGVEELHGEA